MPAATDETIVAVSSPPGRSRRGVIRLSGPGTKGMLEGLSATPPLARPRTLCHVRLDHIVPATSLPALAWFSPGPGSYTGDDLAEIQLPGNPALLERAIRVLIEAGARHAHAGEFTFRAYLAGKLDLTEAEGINATISAVSDSQLTAAGMLRQGQLGSFAQALVDALGEALALTEAGIDFIDQEDVSAISAEDLHRRLSEIERRLVELLKRSRAWGAIEALPRVVLVGPPSSGKSTLFNALLGQSRAVIDQTAGTTRDVLAEPVTLTRADLPSVEIMLVDMAGLDEPTAGLDHQAQEAASEAKAQADLLILLGEEVRSDDAKPTIRIHPKADLGLKQHSSEGGLPVSAVSGQNLDALRARIVGRLGDRAVSVRADMLALQPRHESLLRRAAAHVNEAKTMVDAQDASGQLDDAEMLASTLRAALDELESLGGRLSPDQVIGRIFANFCVGK